MAPAFTGARGPHFASTHSTRDSNWKGRVDSGATDTVLGSCEGTDRSPARLACDLTKRLVFSLTLLILDSRLFIASKLVMTHEAPALTRLVGPLSLQQVPSPPEEDVTLHLGAFPLPQTHLCSRRRGGMELIRIHDPHY